ncbi:hypothetical protein EWM64_g864 [Hericium alpestre]|uniref:Uncharacterized protein n=1 Tax=Hericium alpestre TaxID=135208 RepID=A0A4Z0AAZ3_9AGAM|nr:hypothetical protein EWM64_g864 [Hericium alpestre]
MPTEGGHIASRTKLILLSALSITSLLTTLLLFSLVQKIEPNGFSKQQGNLDINAFTFVGDDFPDYLPIDMGEIRIEGGKEWPSFSISVDLVDRTYRFGPQNRTFVLAMIHELHCIETFEEVIAKGEYPPWTLCDPDLTLEPGDFVKQGPSRDLVPSTRTCRNWDVLYQHIIQNYRNWVDFIEKQGWQFSEWYVVSPVT